MGPSLEHEQRSGLAAIQLSGSADEAVLSRPTRAPHLADQLEREIVDAGWPVGSLVGTEAELLERFDVGRGVLREAARLLEDRQIARMRRGRGGGLIVLEPDVRAVTDATAIYLESLGVTPNDIFEARQVLDLFAVGLAADRIDEKNSTRLRELLQQEQEADELQIMDGSHRQIHAAIAEASGNPVIAVFAEALSLLSEDQDDLRGRLTGAASRRAVAGVHWAHQSIIEAIISGDGLLASHRMLKHLNALRQDFVHRSERAEIRTNDPASSGQTGRVLSRRIRHDIAKMNWPIDHNLGSETELLERYATGRGTLREAVRLLEYHSAVQMRRGPGGGLIVRAPDGESVMRAVALHLAYRGIRSVDLFEAREALEMAALQLAIERLTEEGTDRLTRALDDNDLSSVGFAQSAHDFHVVIAELSGNQTLQLFVAILTRITAKRLEEPGAQRATTPGNVREQVDYAHRKIVDAILDGDVPLARRRMRLHLRSLECSIA